MNGRSTAASLAAVLVGAVAFAQAPVSLKLRWPAPGGAMLYRVEYTTTQTHKLKETVSEAKSSSVVTRRWEVAAVDAEGCATLRNSITTLRQERTTGSGSVWKFDSESPKDSTPEMREAMSRHLNVLLATVKVDPFGRVMEVKDSKSGPSAFENELPFLGTVPGAELKPGAAWTREYKVTLAPPLGTGEKYDAVQKFTVAGIKDGLVTVTTSCELKEKPKAAADMVSLWQFLPKGEIVWDSVNGRLHSARLTVEEEASGLDGEGSHTKFTSTKVVTFLPVK
jgi:hypothetical protein